MWKVFVNRAHIVAGGRVRCRIKVGLHSLRKDEQTLEGFQILQLPFVCAMSATAGSLQTVLEHTFPAPETGVSCMPQAGNPPAFQGPWRRP
jgi:hypothetical protein